VTVACPVSPSTCSTRSITPVGVFQRVVVVVSILYSPSGGNHGALVAAQSSANAVPHASPMI
jgi:hypothetical protein